MRRRQLLYGVGMVGGILASGAGIGTTTAQSSVAEFSVSDTHVETHNGELDELWIQRIHTEVSWSGFDAPADVVDISLTATYDDGIVEGISTGEIEVSGDEYSGTVETELPSVDLVSVFETETFEVAEGETETFEFSFTLRMTVVDTSGQAVTSEAIDNATAVLSYYPDDEIVDVIDNLIITTDGTVATIVNETDEDVCVTLEWVHSGHGTDVTRTFVDGNSETVVEPPGGAGGAPSYDINAVGYERGEC